MCPVFVVVYLVELKCGNILILLSMGAMKMTSLAIIFPNPPIGYRKVYPFAILQSESKWYPD